MISAWWLIPAVWGGAFVGVMAICVCQVAAADRFMRDGQ